MKNNKNNYRIVQVDKGNDTWYKIQKLKRFLFFKYWDDLKTPIASYFARTNIIEKAYLSPSTRNDAQRLIDLYIQDSFKPIWYRGWKLVPLITRNPFKISRVEYHLSVGIVRKWNKGSAEKYGYTSIFLERDLETAKKEVDRIIGNNTYKETIL